MGSLHDDGAGCFGSCGADTISSETLRTTYGLCQWNNLSRIDMSRGWEDAHRVFLFFNVFRVTRKPAPVCCLVSTYAGHLDRCVDMLSQEC